MRKLIQVLSVAVLIGGCAAPLTTREKGVLAGGALGAGAGAIIGNQMDHQAEGALIGGALGAVSGGLIGNQLYGQELRQNAQLYELEQQRRELERQRRELEALRRSRDPYAYERGNGPNYSSGSDPRYDYRGAY